MKTSLNHDLKKNKIILFGIILIVFFNILLHILAINLSSNDREIIWEPDDNYHQLIKAKNLFTCNKNCKGINNILKYDYENLDIIQKANLDIYLHHSAIEYHYIKSILLIFVNKFNNDWELSQILLSKITSVLLITLIIINIKILFNSRIALIAAIIILPYVQIKYGLHFSNGSDELAAIFALLSLIYLCKHNIKIYLLSVIFSGLAIFSHPIGIFMLLFNYIFIFFKNKFKLNKEILIYYFSSSLIIILYFNLDFNYLNESYNFINLYNNFKLDIHSIKNIFISNVKNNLYFLYDIFNLLNIFILIIIFFVLRSDVKSIFYKYQNLLPLIASSFFIILLSLFHYAPEASILTRMQQILTFSILSFYSVLIFEFLIKILDLKIKYYLIGICLIIFSIQSLYNINNLNKKIESNKQTLNLSINNEKLQLIQKDINDKKIVFKKNNIDRSSFKAIYYKFLLEGFNNKNVYLDEFLTKEEKKEIKLKNFLLVLPSPILNNNLIYKEERPNCFKLNSFYKCIKRGWYGKSRTRMSDLLIYNNDKIEIISDSSNQIKLGINRYDNEFILVDENQNKNFIINNNEPQHYDINLNQINKNKKILKFKLRKNQYIKLYSLKSNNTIKYNWPWGEDLKLIHHDSNITRIFDFNLKKMIGDYYCDNYKLINDTDSYIIIDMQCEK